MFPRELDIIILEGKWINEKIKTSKSTKKENSEQESDLGSLTKNKEN